jgi:hypothetical protein
MISLQRKTAESSELVSVNINSRIGCFMGQSSSKVLLCGSRSNEGRPEPSIRGWKIVIVPHGDDVLEIGAESEPVLAEANGVLSLAHSVVLLQVFLHNPEMIVSSLIQSTNQSL